MSTNLVFKPIFDKELDELICSRSTPLYFEKGNTFLIPGDEIDHIYYLREGQTKHYMVKCDGTEKILYKLTPGWLFGETAFFLGRVTGLYSQAETDITLYRIDQSTIRELFEENKQFAYFLLKCCCQKLLILRHEVENLTFNPCKDRIKRFYFASVDKNNIIDGKWYAVRVKPTRYELGIIVGAARVTVSKLIRELCDEGFMRVINGNIEVSVAEHEEYARQH